MNNFNELLTLRRSMRKFTDEELTKDEVVTLLKAALMAPTSKGKHSWEFVVVDDKEQLSRLGACKAHGSDFIAEAPLAVVVMGDPLVSDAWIEDASVASILLQLQAEDLGLGSCWSQIRERESANGGSAEQYVREVVNAPLQMQVLSIIAIGHKGMERKPFNEDNLLWEKIHLNTFA
jgi:nitroreductase